MSFQTGQYETEGKGERCELCGKPISGKMIVMYFQVFSKTLSKESRGQKKQGACYHPECKTKSDSIKVEIDL